MLGSGVAGCKESQKHPDPWLQVLSLEDREGEVALWSSWPPFLTAWVLQAQRRAWS